MVTTPEAIEEPGPTMVIEKAVRTVVAGHVQGAVRRIALYLVVGLVLALYGGVLAGVGLVALLLLALTDNLA